jgi:hypothetical protein
VPFNCTVAPF